MVKYLRRQINTIKTVYQPMRRGHGRRVVDMCSQCTVYLTAMGMLLGFSGLPAEGGADAVGEPHHGHLRLTGPGHRAAHREPAEEEALRTQQAPHLKHHDQEHPGARSLPARHHLHPVVRRYVL